MDKKRNDDRILHQGFEHERQLLSRKGKATRRKIETLIGDTLSHYWVGIGSPEKLIGDYKGYWSRRINGKDRLIYRVHGESIFLSAAWAITMIIDSGLELQRLS